MKKILLFAFVAFVVTASVLSPVAQAQRKNLTFIVNTATVPDTLKATENDIVIIGSGKPADADSVLTSWATGQAMTNIGGDYWKVTLGFKVGDTLFYKFRVHSGGWEQDLAGGDGGGHRYFTDVTKDTTFPVQFWNNGPSADSQYFRPWTAVPDSFISVYFRVNMQAIMDNGSFGWTAADVDSVGVRGAGKAGDDLSWGPTTYLKQEVAPTANGSAFAIAPGSFFSGRLKFRKSQWNVGDTLQYKFLLGWNWGRDELQGGKPNRTFTIPVGKADTTLEWVYYDNEVPVLRSNIDSCTVTFQANMTAASNNGSFKIGSDTVQVQVGFFTTADSTRTLNLSRQGLTNIYKGTMGLFSSKGKFLDYQYYLVKAPNTIREYFYNFQFTGTVASEQERRQFTVPSSAGAFTIKDTVVSISDGRREPYFSSQAQFTQNVLVTWTVDMRPAYYQLIYGGIKDSLVDGQGPSTVVYPDSIKKWGVAINGPGINLPNVYPVTDWADWNSLLVADTSKRKMWDDGTHGDLVAGDSIYSAQFSFTTANYIGAVTKFGIRGGDNEGGFGNNHLDNIPSSGPTATVAAQWGSIDPVKYNHWNYDTHTPIVTAVASLTNVPKVFALQQNYPNPFNPTTKIAFSIPSQVKVELTVYNILGQKVATLVNETMSAGSHETSFDASRLASGMYIYRITAGQFTSAKKMLLLK